MHNHQWTCQPAEEQRQAKREHRVNVISMTLSIVVFATIGVLLAWRG